MAKRQRFCMPEYVHNHHTELRALLNDIHGSAKLPSEKEILAVDKYNKAHGGNLRISYIRNILISYKYQRAIKYYSRKYHMFKLSQLVSSAFLL